MLASSILLSFSASGAALAVVSPNQFGAQDRANAISLMTVLAVQQGISSLPATSGQSPKFVYDFDLDAGSWVPSLVLGPTVLRSAETIGAHTFTLRYGVSYFELAKTFQPIEYLVEFEPSAQGARAGVVGLGARTDVNVTVMNLAMSYGLTPWVELTFNLPVTVVRAQASQISSTIQNLAGVPPADAKVAGVLTKTPLPSDPAGRATAISGLSREFGKRISPSCQLGPDTCLTYREDSFTALGFDFNDGTHTGVGRISLGGKALLYSSRWAQLALMMEFFAPSPSQAQFAGPDSAAILPRGIVAVPAANWLRFHGDIGYDYDFSESALRRLTWTTGASVPFEQFEFDLGIAGSEYDTAIRWTPTVAHGVADAALGVPASTLTALGDNQLDDNFIDFIGGLKLRLATNWFLSGAVDVPLNNAGFRPVALGTLALEYHVHSG